MSSFSMKFFIVVECIVLALLAAQTILLHAYSSSHTAQGVAAAVVFAVLCLHKWRLELIPGYILFVVNAAVGISTTAPGWLWAIQGVLALLEILFVVLFPLPRFPALSKAHPDIGCITMRFNKVDCRIFYPANPTKPGRPWLRYLHHGKHLAIGLHIFAELPAIFFSSFQNGVLNARVEAPLKSPSTPEGWPVVVFSHGLGGSLEMYSSFAQSLASEGFIVVSLNHSDGSGAVFRNLDNVTYTYYDRPPASYAADWTGLGYQYRNKQLKQRVQHVRDVVDAIIALQNDASSVFYQQINIDKIAVAGHSFGGATALTAAKRDARLKVMVGLDIWMEPLDEDVVAEGVSTVPVCSIISQHWHTEWESHFKLLQANSRHCSHPQSTFLAIEKTRHNNFCDLALFSPFMNAQFKATGSINPTYMLGMVGQLMAAYIRQQFTDETPYDALDGKFPEVIQLKDTTYNTFP
ncbi:unnamed protein product [Aphanomyces euteiches]|uniref:1-alkyl-2-acetylglycerophosphocholine esterase n=1 Tax=Aphanomyces euteiches TaxID=100861 RepID=A0A6G0XIB3_9STRA|nr:hypothetical protein Ae201684_004319 [Aphanomyces euteiches]KAH9093873.1 hypothetical protein Ae201684P_016495 [Aphanomyces euteiches]KAH9135139.1 hypothetical protein AeRB84_019328 [Aphanomyces euteiches]